MGGRTWPVWLWSLTRFVTLGEGRFDRVGIRERVSNLVFYAQSAITVISGEREHFIYKDKDLSTRQTDRQTDRQKTRGGGGG